MRNSVSIRVEDPVGADPDPILDKKKIKPGYDYIIPDPEANFYEIRILDSGIERALLGVSVIPSVFNFSC